MYLPGRLPRGLATRGGGVVTRLVLMAVALLLMAHSVVTSLSSLRRQCERDAYARTVRAARWWMVPAALVQLSVVIGTYAVLVWLFPPLRWGWWSAVGGVGNLLLGQTGGQGWAWRALAFAMPLVVLALLPRWAQIEEDIFRAGSERRTRARRAVVHVVFGLVHCIVGIPIGAGIALIVSGIYFEQVYLRALRRGNDREAAVDTAAAAHAVSNGIVVGALLVTLVGEAL